MFLRSVMQCDVANHIEAAVQEKAVLPASNPVSCVRRLLGLTSSCKKTKLQAIHASLLGEACAYDGDSPNFDQATV